MSPNNFNKKIKEKKERKALLTIDINFQIRHNTRVLPGTFWKRRGTNFSVLAKFQFG